MMNNIVRLRQVSFNRAVISFSLALVAMLLIMCRCSPLTSRSTRIDGLWVGSYAHEIYRVHYPVLLDFKSDGRVMKIDFRRQDDHVLLPYSLKDSVLTIDTVRYIIKYHTENELSLYNKYEIRFQRPQNARQREMKAEDGIKRLNNKTWLVETPVAKDQLIQTINHITISSNEGILKRDYLIREKILTSEFEICDFQIREFAGQLFFLRKGEINDSRWRHVELEQILDMQEDYFVTYKAGSAFGSPIKYSTATFQPMKKIDEADVFKICYTDPIKEYFNVGIKYRGGFRELTKFIYENYTSGNLDGESGYVRIRFVINCEGKPGRFDVKGFDADLAPRAFNPEIVSKLLQLTQKLVDWESSSGQKQTDCNKFLTYKLAEGQIIEILP